MKKTPKVSAPTPQAVPYSREEQGRLAKTIREQLNIVPIWEWWQGFESWGIGWQAGKRLVRFKANDLGAEVKEISLPASARYCAKLSDELDMSNTDCEHDRGALSKWYRALARQAKPA